MTLISLTAVSLLRDRSGIDLSINTQAEQEIGATIFDKRKHVEEAPAVTVG